APVLRPHPPSPPGSFNSAAAFRAFFPPVRDSLSANPRMREAGIFDPDTKSGGIVGRARNALRIDSGEQRIAQSDELWRSGPAPRGACRVFIERRDEVGFLEKIQVVRNRFKRTGILKLSLDLLQRNNLSGRYCAHAEHLAQ